MIDNRDGRPVAITPHAVVEHGFFLFGRPASMSVFGGSQPDPTNRHPLPTARCTLFNQSHTASHSWPRKG